MMLDRYVSPDVIFKVGFNWYEPSYSFDKGNLNYRVYHSYLENRNLNIIVIEVIRKNNGRADEFYFFTIEGKHPTEFSFNEEREFFDKLRKGIIQGNRVSGEDLGRKILNVIGSGED